MADYCNVTTDLTDVYPSIDDFQLKERVEEWTIASGQTYTYYKGGTGQVNQVFEDDLQMTVQTSIANVEANAGSYYYDSDNDVLYIQTTGTDIPTDYLIEIGEDWDSFKTRMRDKAQQIIDAYLNTRYSTPLMPRINQDHDSTAFEYPIVRATSLYTCYLIVNRRNPGSEDALKLLTEVYNHEEPKGIIKQILDGDLVLQDQISPREAGKWNIRVGSSNSTELLLLRGSYTGSSFEKWKLVIDGAGAPGTATYKLSYDNGGTYDYTSQDTRDDGDSLYVDLGYGLYAYFPASTYSVDDEWTIDLFPLDADVQGAKAVSIAMER